MVIQNQPKSSSLSFLPEDVWQIMLSPKTIEFNKKIREKYKLSPEDSREMVLLEEAVFKKNIPPYAFSKMLAEKTKIDLDTAQKITEEITKKLFLPIKDYLGPLTGPLIKPKPVASEKEEKPKEEIVEKHKEEKEIKISPYEQKRETPVIKPEIKTGEKIKEEKKDEEEKAEIPTFPKITEKPKQFSVPKPITRIIKEEKRDEEQKKAKEVEKKFLLKKGDYKIRTMKEDVKKVKEGLSSSKQ